MSIELYFDFVSPYSYLAFSQRGEIAKATGIGVNLRPVSVRGIMAATNNTPTSITCPAKRQYALGDVMRWAKRYGVRIMPHPSFGRFPTEPLLQAALAAEDVGLISEFCDAAFGAIWRDSAPIADDTAMGAYFEERIAGGKAVWERKDKFADALAANTQTAVEAGAFGVPTFVTPNGMFFGNDRIEFLIEAMAA
jgi:2-hydroxychromene-2-carboxylate isomerase